MLKGLRIGLIVWVLMMATGAFWFSPATAQAGARIAARPFDFNGDGFADLAVGVPGEDIGSGYEAGAIQVIYGSAGGLTAVGDDFLTQDSPGIKGRVHTFNYFGLNVESGDFDGDGYADVAATARSFAVEGSPLQARIGLAIIYGGRHGLTSRDQLLRVDANKMTVGDFNGDGFTDLVAAATWSSAVTVLSGSASGISPGSAKVITPDSPGIPGGPDGIDSFGHAMAAGDLNGDGVSDLALSARRATGPLADWRVYFLPGSPAGLQTTSAVVYDQSTPGLVSNGTYLASFGDSLAVGDFDGNGQPDLAVGDALFGQDATGDCGFGDDCPGGSVFVLPGSPSGPNPEQSAVWSQDSPMVPDQTEYADYFGSAIAAGDLNNDGYDDLAVGAWQEALSRDVGPSGAVTIMYGSPTGLTGQGSQLWSQASPGIKGAPELNDMFGVGVRVLDFGKSRSHDLAVTVAESVHGKINAGAVQVLYGSRAGLNGVDRLWHQDVPGIKGKVEESDYFGPFLP